MFTVLKTAIVEALNYSPALETERSPEELVQERQEIEDICGYFRNIRKSLSIILDVLK